MKTTQPISNSYRFLGHKSNFYDGMITCCTWSGKVMCKVVWNMDSATNAHYLQAALASVSKNFQGRLLEVPVKTGGLTMPL